MFLKTAGGITRGRGISLTNTAKLVPSDPDTSRVIDAIETCGGVDCATSGQRVDMPESRQSRNHVDEATFLNWLNPRNPFE